MRHANDGLRFLLELALLASLAVWGWSAGGGVTRWALAVAAPAAAGAFWGVLLAPKSPRRVADPWRLVAEVVAFGSGVLGLVGAGRATWALVLGALVVLHLVLTFVLGRRR